MLALFSTKAFKRPCRSLKACPSSHTSCKPVNNNYQAGLQSMSAISIMTEGSVVGMQGRSSAQCALVLLPSLPHGSYLPAEHACKQ